MRYAFLLIGGLEVLALAEVKYLFSTPEIVDGRIAVVEVCEPLFYRLALTKEVIELLEVCDYSELEDAFAEIPIPSQPLCVRVKRFRRTKTSTQELERKLGEILWRRGAKISVSSPKSVVKVYIADKAYVGLLRHVTDTKQFEERHPNKRPFFKPGVMLPRISRALVNIAVKDGLFLDPMCGTGGLLIEAGLMGLDYVGVDAFSNVVEGCARNLRYYGLHPSVLRGDAKILPFKDSSVSGIATDFPYLQSSKSFGSLEELYCKAIPEFARVLRFGCRAVLVSNIDIEEIVAESFEVLEVFRYKVHGSLTRRIYVCSNSKGNSK
ncbi:MAG: hypothetical protein DRO98_08630 [Archaeoglobales archaeon]|nr:MAG: hypothetical protein DRO98_08630 [Archaeoglobales archaeon]